MLPRYDEPFPFEAVRDLLGVVRTIYAAAKAGGAGRAELARIGKVGTELSAAHDLAADTRENTVGRAAAWKRAEAAARQVGDLIDTLTPAEPLVAAAQARVARARAKPSLRKKRSER